MGVDSEDSQKLPARHEVLRREVLYPQGQNTGVGVMLVASAAMFFAVASSAFILRAQMPSQGCAHETSEPEPPSESLTLDVESIDVITGSDEACGGAIYLENPNGPDTVLFNLCPPEQGYLK